MLALRTKLTLMLVVLLVTGQAIKARTAKTLKVFVASDTFCYQFGVGVTQLKAGSIMVEPACGGFPVAFTVTISALFPKVATVLIVFLVATPTILGRFLE